METRIKVTPANIPSGLNLSLRLTTDNSLAGINIWPHSLQKAEFSVFGFPQFLQVIRDDLGSSSSTRYSSPPH